VAIKVKLGLIEMLLTKDPTKATTTLQQLKSDADEALETLRDLARGIYPPLLAERGLVTALQAQARKATLPVTVEADGIGRYPQDTEAALYFCVLEALQNIQKYARATSALCALTGRRGSALCRGRRRRMWFRHQYHHSRQWADQYRGPPRRARGRTPDRINPRTGNEAPGHSSCLPTDSGHELNSQAGTALVC
jgi:hypothetical protein